MVVPLLLYLLHFASIQQAAAQNKLLYFHENISVGAGFGTINLDTLELNVISTDVGFPLTDIAFSPTGELYGIGFANFVKIDPARGTILETKPLTGIPGANALVFGTDSTLYAAGNGSSQLFTIEFSGPTAVGTPFGKIGNGVASAGDLAFDLNGNLFLSALGNELWRLDVSRRPPDLNTNMGMKVRDFNSQFTNVFGIATAPDGRLLGYGTTKIFEIQPSANGSDRLLIDYADLRDPQTNARLRAAGGGTFFQEAVPNIAPSVESRFIDVIAGANVDYTFLGIDPDSRPQPLTWTLDSFSGPGTALNPSFDSNNRRLVWNTTGSSLGTYTAVVRAFDGNLSGSGTLTIRLVPEPSALVLSMACAMGFLVRRR
jgi:hypothetical protein